MGITTVEGCDREIERLWKLNKQASLSGFEHEEIMLRIDVCLDVRLQIQREAEAKLVGNPQGA